jgi:hypothetical protein
VAERELAAARLKLLASLPAELQERAGRASQLFHVNRGKLPSSYQVTLGGLG